MKQRENFKFICNTALLCFMILLLVSPTKAIVKCNRRLLNEFGLIGLDYALYERMEVCRHVHEKCCTLIDEIRIYKYWNEYSKPIIDSRTHDYMLYTRGILQQFNKMMELDPQLIILKYSIKRKIPLEHETCYQGIKEENKHDEKEYAKLDDLKATLTYSKIFYSQIKNKKKKFNVKKHVMDSFGSRHYGVMPTKNHQILYKRYGRKAIPKFQTEKVDVHNIKCRKTRDTFTKDFVIVNEVKTKYCLGLYRKFLLMDNDYLIRFLPIVKNYLHQNMNLKSGAYCSVCDAHQQEFFNVEKKQIMIQERFCKSLLHNKKDLFNFMHVFFVEYMDSLLQYVQCFETDGKTFSFPFKNFMAKYMRRIGLIKACLDNTDTPDFMAKCWFICKSYKFFGVDWFYNGDVDLVKRVYLTLFSFLHKLSQSMDEFKEGGQSPDYIVDDNVNGLLVEPLNPGYAISKHYYIEDKTRENLLGKLDTRYTPAIKDKKEREKVTKEADKLLHNLGLPKLKDVEKLRKEQKELKTKYQKVKEVHKQLSKYKDIKQIFDKFKKQDENRKKGLKKEATSIDKLSDALVHIKKKKDIHDGYRPQRNLLEDNSLIFDVKKALKDYGLSDQVIEEQFNKSKTKERYLKKTCPKKPIDKEDKNKDKNKEDKLKEEVFSNEKDNTKSHEDIHQIYEKNKQSLGVAKFETLWGEDGIDPFKSFELINYRFNITTLIEKKFEEEETIQDSVITTFLTNSAHSINAFNFDAFTDVYAPEIVKNHKYERLRKIELYAKRNDRDQLLYVTRKKLRDLIKRHIRTHKRMKDYKELLLRRKKARERKKVARLNKHQLQKYHTLHENFEENFLGIKKYFLYLFGH